MLLAVLVAVVTGCDGTPRYDTRLAAADSLMRDNPDSALAIVETINRGSLATTADSAYHDLLLTQARYRCYIVATSDSDINRALAYYRSHDNEREKLTRAYIYKGAVMEELGHPDSAMLYYKHAEATAAPDDYFNLGYINMMMGALYNDYYSMEGQETLKYEEALDFFRKTKDSVFILICLNNLGCFYREQKPDKAKTLLLEAAGLARCLNDTARILYNDLSLVVLYQNLGSYQEARQLIREIVGFEDYASDYKTDFTAANIYARLGMLDSAEFFLNLALQNRNGDDALFKMHHLKCLSEIALARNDTLQSIRFVNQSNRIEDSLTANAAKLEIIHTEVNYDKESIKKSRQAHNNTVTALILVLVFALVFVPVFLYRRAHRYDQLIADLNEEIKNQSIDLKTLQHNVDKLKIKDSELKKFFESHSNMLREVIEECYHSPQGPLAKEIKRIVKFQDNNTGMWSKLYSYLDLEYNNIMNVTMKNYPQLDDKELLMIALTCMGYSCAQIAIVLDYSSSAGISTVRKRIAKKMGVDGLLADYIKQFQSPHH